MPADKGLKLFSNQSLVSLVDIVKFVLNDRVFEEGFPILGYEVILLADTLLPRGSPFGDPGPHGDLFQFLGPQKVPIFFPGSPFSLFQAEERAKSHSSHCLLNVDHLNTCDDKTSLNEHHASLSVKLNL